MSTTPGDPDRTVDTPGGTPLADPNLAPLAERFVLLAELGRGGMGVVYKARDKVTDEVVALKVLRPEISADPVLIERFKNELRLSRKITHKSVCRIHDLHQFGTVAAITMEFVEGETLRSWLNKNESFSVRRGTRLAQQIIAGLAEAHSQNVVHRDLKPENLMLDSDGNVKIMDFGIARSLSADTTVTGGLIGTPAYMSPEQAEGKEVDHRTDIYSFGLILYEMFTGQRAVEGDTPVAVAFKHVHETPTSPREVDPDLPPRIERTVLTCLEKDPKKRFQSVDEVLAALGQRDEPISPSSPLSPGDSDPDLKNMPIPPRLSSWQRSDWKFLFTGITGLILFLVLVPYFHPTAFSSLEIDRDEARRIVKEAFEKIGWEYEEPKYTVSFSSWESPVWREAGIRPMQEIRSFITKTPFAIGRWSAWTPDPWQLSFQGEIIQLGRGTSGRSEDILALSQYEKNPADEARAANVIQSVFGVDVTSLDRVEPGEGWRKIHYRWFLKPATSIPVSVGALILEDRVRFVGYEFHGSRWFDRPDEVDITGLLYDGNYVGWLFPLFVQPQTVLILVGLLVIVLGLFYQRGVIKQPVHGATLLLAIVIAGASTSIRGRLVSKFIPTRLFEYEIYYKASVVFLIFLLLVILLYIVLSVTGYYARRSMVHTVASFYTALSRPIQWSPPFLSILRGALVGCMFLGVFALLLWAASFKTTIFAHSELGGMGFIWDWPVLVRLLLPPLSAFWASTLFLGLPLALIRRTTERRWLVLTGIASFWLLTGFMLQGPLIGPWWATHIGIAAQGLFFGWVVLRFDLLTAFASVYTVETFLLQYPGHLFLQKIYPYSYLVGIMVWAGIVFLALVVYFRSELGLARRRVAAVFE